MIYCMTASFAMAADNSKLRNINIHQVKVQEVKAFDSKIDTIYNQQVNGNSPQFVLKTSVGDIPVFIKDTSVSAEKLSAGNMESFINGATQSAKDDLNKTKSGAIDQYEFITIDPDATYTYCDYPEGRRIIITPSGQSVQSINETGDSGYSILYNEGLNLRQDRKEV